MFQLKDASIPSNTHDIVSDLVENSVQLISKGHCISLIVSISLFKQEIKGILDNVLVPCLCSFEKLVFVGAALIIFMNNLI